MTWTLTEEENKYMPRPTLGEMFDTIRTAKTPEEKAGILKKNAGPAIYFLLKLGFMKPIWLLPTGAPPFKQDPARGGATPSHLMRELKHLYLFVEGGRVPALAQPQREKLFQRLLERMNELDNELLVSIKDGNLSSKYKLPKKVVEDTFPGLLVPPLYLQFLQNRL